MHKKTHLKSVKNVLFSRRIAANAATVYAGRYMVFFKNHVLHVCTYIFFLFFISSCVSQPTKKSDFVKQNAKLALEDCGKGNVKEVTINGYECKKIDVL